MGQSLPSQACHRVLGLGWHLIRLALTELFEFPYFVDLQALGPQARETRSGGLIRFLPSGRLVNSIKGYDLALVGLYRAVSESGIVNCEMTILSVALDL